MNFGDGVGASLVGTHPVRNKAVAILAQMQAGWLALIQKDGREMLIDLAVRFTQRPLQIRLVAQWQL